MTGGSDADERLPVLGIVCGGLVPVAAFYAIGPLFFRGWLLDLGSFHLPTPYHTYFLFTYAMLGVATAGALTVGFGGLLSRENRFERLVRGIDRPSERVWLASLGAVAVLVPIAVRFLLLDGARLTDDEGAYLFMSRVLAQGQLAVESHPAGAFFDRFAMVNDGAYYAQYFVGWPAVLAPFSAAGLPWLANPVVAGSTVVGLYLSSRRLMGETSARVTTVLFVGSPFVAAMGATLLSHLACLHWLVWTFWATVRARDGEAPLWVHALLAVCFSAAFFTRPSVALGLGGPLLVAWAWQRPSARDWIAFAAPAILFAALFFAVNAVQTGSVFTTAYEAFYEYRRASLEADLPSRRVPNFDFAHPANGLALTAIGLFRLNFALWGWPCAFVFVVFAGIGGWRRLVWASAGGFLAVHFAMTDSGMDSFGPVHYFELSLPILLLTVAGLRRATRGAGELRLRGEAGTMRGLKCRVLPAAAVAAMMFTAAVYYVPVRWMNLGRLAEQHNTPVRAVEAAELDEVVVFADHRFVDCPRDPDGFVGWPPYNSPGFDDSVLWANHLTLERDRAFLRREYPNRTGYLLEWREGCEVELRRLEELDGSMVGPGYLHRIREELSVREGASGD